MSTLLETTYKVFHAHLDQIAYRRTKRMSNSPKRKIRLELNECDNGSIMRRKWQNATYEIA